jgi:spore germination protein GerM
MPDPNQRGPLGAFPVLISLAFVVAGGAAWLTWNFSNSTPQGTPTNTPSVAQTFPPATPLTTPPTTQTAPPLSPSPPIAQTAQVYWVKSVGDKTEFVAIPVQLTINNKATTQQSDASANVTAALQQLLAGPTDPDVNTTIPDGTQLRSVKIEADGVHVDLSREFTTGGGSESMKGRLGQVIFTATGLKPEQPVWIAVEGKPLEVLGGEGLVIEQPLTRSSFQRDYAQ